MVKRITNNFGFPNKLVCIGAADILVTKINGGMMIEKTTADNKLGIFGWTQGCHISSIVAVDTWRIIPSQMGADVALQQEKLTLLKHIFHILHCLHYFHCSHCFYNGMYA